MALRRALQLQQAARGGAAAAGLLQGPLLSPAVQGGAAAPPAAALALARPYATGTRETLAEAMERVKKMAEASASAARTAGSAVARAPDALYRALPAPAQRLVNATQTPGAVNRVLSLQLTAFWQHHSNAIIAAAAAGTCYASWRALLRVSEVLGVDVAHLSAGFLALSASGVAGTYLFLRRRYTIDPQQAYRLAMYRLNTHPGLLEVMGAPLVGSPVRASVLTGGGIHFRGLRPRLQSKRIQMIFPLKGAERRGLVSLEAKKRHGHLRFKLLAVDVPSVGGGEQRIFLEGGPSLYERGGVLGVLRDPFIRALSMEEAFMAEDEAEDAEEERDKAVAAAQRAAAAAAKQPKPMDEGGGLYFYEKVLLGAQRAWGSLGKQAPPLTKTSEAAAAAAEQQAKPPPAAAAAAGAP